MSCYQWDMETTEATMKLTREAVVQLVTRKDAVAMNAVGRALVHLLNRQTREESRDNTTRNLNDVGFTPADARFGCIHAKYFIRHRMLTDWQVAYWVKPNAKGVPRIAKYWRQLAEEAEKRAQQKAAA
jgi:hypothetical protein